ncbi:hypothetical protein DU002_11765 [Corallincola holothuriorum]|uniref:Uncharacterized protein n=1 Tax=Corallincola holothuriorum TaxID=2282215 RepID=A0A368NHD0_9GAMM|nr:hypothetical protein [Corallincola holothuriorum]RCU49586.1 hypothetical protein DU002_11765 [Corallincola holothuriorum]
MSETLNETSALALQMKIIDDPTWQQQRQAHWDEEHQDAYAECWPRTTVKAVKQLFMRGEINRKGLAKFSAGQRVALYFQLFPVQSREAFIFILGQLEGDEIANFNAHEKAGTFFYALLKIKSDIRHDRFADQSKAQRLAIFDWFWGDKFDLNRRVPCLVGGSSQPIDVIAMTVLRHFLSSIFSWMDCAEKHQPAPFWLERMDYALSAFDCLDEDAFSIQRYDGHDKNREGFQRVLWGLLAGPIKSAVNKLPAHIKEMNQIRDKLIVRFREIADHKPAFDSLWQHIDKHGVDFERKLKITFTLSEEQLIEWRSTITQGKSPTYFGDDDRHERWSSTEAIDSKLRRLLKRTDPLLDKAWADLFCKGTSNVELGADEEDLDEPWVQLELRKNINGTLILLYIFPESIQDVDALEVGVFDIISQLPVSDLFSWQYFGPI